MTIRNDITIDWNADPRIVTVDSPSTEITMQDLLDTLRSEESKAPNVDDDSIVDAAGKEDLGGGVYVGLTVTLLNARLAFEARPGPTFAQCKVSGGNLVALDSDGNTMNAIEPTAYTQIVLANSSSATLQTYASGSGLSTEEHDQLMALPQLDETLSAAIDSGVDLKAAMQVILAALAGKAAGGGTATISFRDQGDTKDLVTMTVDENGNRTSIALNTD